ncbi:unnamed protein product [Mytilus edulis]|uniref:MRC n=1 Tax=Mytilus edulis TaxID=6550 RepID=A0A8S3PXY6_MYTED|nr:unnamed protein product [Mytilus edulis]
MDCGIFCLHGFIILISFRVSDSGNSNYQLIFNPTSMSWIGAATWCQMKGGEVVTIDSQAVVSMIDWYKDNDWSSQWSAHVWTGLYAFGIDSGLWQGTCASLDFLFVAPSETYSSGAPCMYMDKDDLYWHYDDCASKHHVVCQVQNGVCEFDDQNMAIDKKLSSLSSVPATTLDDCKTKCQNYQNGEQQCWAVKYQNSANKCYMYASISPQDYFSSTSNTNKNLFYSTRECFSSSIVIENEPSMATDIDTVVESCLPTTTSRLESTNVPVTSIVSTHREQFTTQLTSENNKYSTAISTIPLLTTIILGETTSITTDSSTTEFEDTTRITSDKITTTLKADKTTTLSTEGAITAAETTSSAKEDTTTLTTQEISSLTLSTDKTTPSTKEETPTKSLINYSKETSIITTNQFTTVSKGYTMSGSFSSNWKFPTYLESTTSEKTEMTTDNVTISTTLYKTTTLNRFNESPVDVCSYDCPCMFGNGTVTIETLDARLQQLKAVLQIDKKETSSYVRKRTCATDSRPSAKNIGYIGILILVIVFGSIVMSDLISLVRFLQQNWLKKDQ